MNGLCAAWTSFAVDGIIAFVLLAFALISAKKGFVECFFGFISTIAAIILAFSFMKPMIGWTGGLFGLQDKIGNGCISMFTKIEGFNIDISAAGLQTSLADKNLPQFLIDAIVKNFGNATLPAGTTLALLVGSTLGGYATNFLSWVLVFILAKLLLRLLKNIFSSIVESLPIIRSLNALLGLLVGLLQGLLIVCGVVAIFSLLPSENITTFFNQTVFVRWIYNHNPINIIIGWIL